MRVSKQPLIGGILLLSLSHLAIAQYPTEKGGDGRTTELGIGIELEPFFAGADDTETEIDPYINIAWRNGQHLWFTTITDYGYYRNLNNRWTLGGSIGIEFGREEADDEALTGLGDIDDTAELRVDAIYHVSPAISVGARAMTAGAEKDEVYFLAGIYRFDLDDSRLEIKLMADVSYATSKHLRTEFGVSPEQSLRSGLPIYSPDAGLKSFGLTVDGRYWWNNQWFTWGEISYERFGDAGKDSPFVQQNYEYEVGLGIGYRF